MIAIGFGIGYVIIATIAMTLVILLYKGER